MLSKGRERDSYICCSTLSVLGSVDGYYCNGNSGPPGVGKTLTVEAISERLQRPLYMVFFSASFNSCQFSAGELDTKPKALEKNLAQIFDIASHWKAILLLDETEVFVEQRATSEIYRNALVCVFLRKLEYYGGILFLTTNRVKTIDVAIASRIHLPLRDESLEQSAQMKVWKSFLKKASAVKGAALLTSKDFERLVKKDLNGREVRISHLSMALLTVPQIKNAVSMAPALASEEDGRIHFSHLEDAIAFNKEFQSDFHGAGRIENMDSYM